MMKNRVEELVPRVVEGDLPLGVHPAPGFSNERMVWSGEPSGSEPEMIGTTAVGTYEAKNEFGADRQWRGRKLIGINVARALALIGMFAVHTLDSWNDEADRASFEWMIFAGNAAALFALLAGVGIALSTGKNRGLTKANLFRARVQLGVRALVMLLIGMLVNHWLDPPVYNILPYYALLFLLALPFLKVRKRTLVLWAALIIIVGPLVQYYIRVVEPFEQILAPELMDLINQPLDVLGTLLFIGTYPISTWFAYILVGMAIGRLPLERIQVQFSLLGYGVLLAALGWITSRLLVFYMGGFEAMLYSEERITQEFVERIMVEGPDPDLPTSSFWWLSVAGPHTNTPFSLVLSTGVALAVLGGALLLCRVWPKSLHFLAVVGSMTLTLYVAHMAFLTFFPFTEDTYMAFAIQVVGAIVIASVWSLLLPKGPLEWLVSILSSMAVAPFKGNDSPSKGKHFRNRIAKD